MLVGIPAGVVLAGLLSWLRRRAIGALLAYTGWVFEQSSLTTKVSLHVISVQTFRIPSPDLPLYAVCFLVASHETQVPRLGLGFSRLSQRRFVLYATPGPVIAV